MHVFGILLGTIVLTLLKGFQVQQQIRTGEYSKRGLALFSFAWFFWTLPGLQAACGDIGCRYSVKFGWFLTPLSGFPPLNMLDPASIITLAMVCYAVLTIYFLGHCIGWLIYGIARLFRLGASLLDR